MYNLPLHTIQSLLLDRNVQKFQNLSHLCLGVGANILIMKNQHLRTRHRIKCLTLYRKKVKMNISTFSGTECTVQFVAMSSHLLAWIVKN